jgi:hypothetical protein
MKDTDLFNQNYLIQYGLKGCNFASNFIFNGK